MSSRERGRERERERERETCRSVRCTVSHGQVLTRFCRSYIYSSQHSDDEEYSHGRVSYSTRVVRILEAFDSNIILYSLERKLERERSPVIERRFRVLALKRNVDL